VVTFAASPCLSTWIMALLCPGYLKKKRLGEGGFGVVSLARRQSDSDKQVNTC